MLSWIFTLSTYTSEDITDSFSAAGTDFIELPRAACHGELRPEDTQQTLESQPQTDGYHLEANIIAPRLSSGSAANETSLLLQHSHSLSHSLEPLEPNETRSRQENLPCRFSPQPLSLYGTFYLLDSKHGRKQCGHAVERSSRASFLGDATSDHPSEIDTGAEASNKPSDFEKHTYALGREPLSGIAGKVPRRSAEQSEACARNRRDSLEWDFRGTGAKCTTGGPLVRGGSRLGRDEIDKESEPLTEPQAEGFYTLDGAQDEVESRQGRAKDRTGGLSVRDRIAALESKAAPSDIGSRTGSREKPAVPIVYPLHYKRFVRRTSSVTFGRPGTPLYVSPPSDDGGVIHSPMPKGLPIPPIKTSPVSPERFNTSTKNIDPTSSIASPSKRKKFTGPQTSTPSRDDRISPATFLHGTTSHCVRHGRKRNTSSSVKQYTGTRDMLDKARNGAYIPTGLAQRRQMEATSPWAVRNESLTKTGNDACPDCVAECRIKRREIKHASVETRQLPDADGFANTIPGSVAQTSAREASRLLPTSPSNFHGDGNILISKDLGEKFDAIIIERAGQLRHVVVISQLNQSTKETLQRLAHELLQVATSMTLSNGTKSPASTTPEGSHDCAVVVDTAHDARDTSLSSVPELLDMIDQAADEIHFNTSKISEHYTRYRDVHGVNDGEPVVSEDIYHAAVNGQHAPMQGIIYRQSLRENYRQLHEHLNNAKARPKSLKTVDSEASLGKRPSLVTARQNDVRPSPKTSQSEVRPKPAQLISSDGDRSANRVPAIVQTRPTLPLLPSFTSRLPATPSIETPTPVQPTPHRPVELSATPTPTTSPVNATPKPQQAVHSYNPFQFLNPFSHTTPAQAKPNPPPSPIPTGNQSLFVLSPTSSPLSPLSPTSSPKPIESNPEPYHHSPPTPPDLAEYAKVDGKAHQDQRVIRQAMRMDGNRTVQDAAALERDLRRQRTAVGGERKGA